MAIRIPRSATRRGASCYAQLILRVHRWRAVNAFEGRLFRCGQTITDEDLRPTPEYPTVPMLIEYAGNDGSGWGHNRSNDIHVLWRYDGAGWTEIARTLSQGPEWTYHMIPIIERELVSPPADYLDIAGKISKRVLDALDIELNAIADEGRLRVMSFLFDQFAARLVA